MARRRERYLVGPGLANKLKGIVSRFDDATLGSGSSASIPVRLQDMGGPRGSNIRLCRTDGAFNKGSVTTLKFFGAGEPPNETQTGIVENVVNKFANIGANKWVAVAHASNGYWYVIAAEC